LLLMLIYENVHLKSNIISKEGKLMRSYSFYLNIFILVTITSLSFLSFANNAPTIKSQFNISYKHQGYNYILQ